MHVKEYPTYIHQMLKYSIIVHISDIVRLLQSTHAIQTLLLAKEYTYLIAMLLNCAVSIIGKKLERKRDVEYKQQQGSTRGFHSLINN